MKLIVGLGNPGRQYRNTPHNVGFDVVDILADRQSATWGFERRFEAETSDIMLAGKPVTLMKPLTYMNLSGRAIASYMGKNGGEPGELLVISDDIHLPLGRLRLRPDGSDGGHKGLLSIINALGTLAFPRLRIGVTPEGTELVGSYVDYVLGSFKPADRETLRAAEQLAGDAVEMIMKNGFTAAMNHFNRKQA